jgi:molecular chaperone HscB
MPADPFDTLGLEPRFDIDPAKLRAAYLRRSAALHPDAAPESGGGAGGEGAGMEAEALAADVNLARQALENPESRADALLRRLGGPTREQERSLPPGFLAEILGIREEIEAAAASRDPAQIERWEQWAEDRRAQLIRAIAGKFAALVASSDPPSLRAIRIELNVWRYVERLVEQLDAGSP